MAVTLCAWTISVAQKVHINGHTGRKWLASAATIAATLAALQVVALFSRPAALAVAAIGLVVVVALLVFVVRK